MPPHPLHRRHFLQQAAAWSTLVALGREAGAQTAGDYKALVCVFMAGGNDAFNTVLATDAASWSAYSTTRNQAPSPIALLAPGTTANPSAAIGSPEWLGGVLPISPTTPQSGRSFALHPRLTQLQGLFGTHRRLAIVANVGPLIEPLTKEQYARASARIPRKLFSHNDQQNTWQALAPEGATVGWGGRLVDAMSPAGQAPNTFSAISLAGNSVWLAGQRVRQYQLSPQGAVALGGASVYGSTRVAQALQRVASNGLTAGTARAQHVLMADLGQVVHRGIGAEARVSAALAGLPTTDARVGPDTRLTYTELDGSTPTNNLARQLQMVARTIGTRASLGPGRQVFFVQFGSFDTHDNQNRRHASLMAQLDHALAYFDRALIDLGVSSQVTTFTASDFGRTFTSNGDGTDHGWGAHHFVMGGAVRGGNIYGAFPTLGTKNASNNQFDTSPDQLGNGSLLPRISVDQLGATLGAWFGLDAAQLAGVFPNLQNFDTRNLGVMVAT